MRRTILYLSLSLDGFIADAQGGVDWLGGEREDYPGDYGYAAFEETVDTIVMGRTTYDQITTRLSPEQWPYPGLRCYVLTHRPVEDRPEATFLAASAEELIRTLREGTGRKDIWICGGGTVARQLIQADLIDVYWLCVLPVLLGDGVSLFQKGGPTIPLRLLRTRQENGVLECVYVRRVLPEDGGAVSESRQ